MRARRSTAGGSTARPGSPGGRSDGGMSMRSARSGGPRDGGGRPMKAFERLYGNAREIALKQERRRQERCPHSSYAFCQNLLSTSCNAMNTVDLPHLVGHLITEGRRIALPSAARFILAWDRKIHRGLIYPACLLYAS